MCVPGGRDDSMTRLGSKIENHVRGRWRVPFPGSSRAAKRRVTRSPSDGTRTTRVTAKSDSGLTAAGPAILHY